MGLAGDLLQREYTDEPLPAFVRHQLDEMEGKLIIRNDLIYKYIIFASVFFLVYTYGPNLSRVYKNVNANVCANDVFAAARLPTLLHILGVLHSNNHHDPRMTNS